MPVRFGTSSTIGRAAENSGRCLKLFPGFLRGRMMVGCRTQRLAGSCEARANSADGDTQGSRGFAILFAFHADPKHDLLLPSSAACQIRAEIPVSDTTPPDRSASIATGFASIIISPSRSRTRRRRSLTNSLCRIVHSQADRLLPSRYRCCRESARTRHRCTKILGIGDILGQRTGMASQFRNLRRKQLADIAHRILLWLPAFCAPIGTKIHVTRY